MLRARRSTWVTINVSPGRRNSSNSCNSLLPVRLQPLAFSARMISQPAARRVCVCRVSENVIPGWNKNNPNETGKLSHWTACFGFTLTGRPSLTTGENFSLIWRKPTTIDSGSEGLQLQAVTVNHFLLYQGIKSLRVPPQNTPSTSPVTPPNNIQKLADDRNPGCR